VGLDLQQQRALQGGSGKKEKVWAANLGGFCPGQKTGRLGKALPSWEKRDPERAERTEAAMYPSQRGVFSEPASEDQPKKMTPTLKVEGNPGIITSPDQAPTQPLFELAGKERRGAYGQIKGGVK